MFNVKSILVTLVAALALFATAGLAQTTIGVDPGSVVPDNNITFSYTKFKSIPSDVEMVDGKPIISYNAGIVLQLWTANPESNYFYAMIYYRKPGMKKALCETTMIVKSYTSKYTWTAIPLDLPMGDTDYQVEAVSIWGIKYLNRGLRQFPAENTAYPYPYK